VPDQEQIERTVAEYLRAGRDGDRDAWLGLFADDATLEDPVGTDVVRGRAELEAFWDRTLGRTEAFDNALRELRVAGDSAAFLFDLFITWKGTMYVVSPIDVQTYDHEGRITSMRAYWNPDDMVPAEG
jgi:steroid delta-isomerase